MDKKVWIEIDNWDKSLITDALENGVDAFFTIKKEYKSKIEALARVDIYEKKALPKDIMFFKIASKSDEENVQSCQIKSL